MNKTKKKEIHRHREGTNGSWWGKGQSRLESGRCKPLGVR